VELGACLADDMGLGKTVQIIALLLHRAKLGPALVVAPTSVCDNWQREVERFAPSLRVRSFAGGDRQQILEGLGPRDIVLVSYTLLQQEVEGFEAIAWSTAVLDEAQFIKNSESLRAKAAFRLRASARVAATGTPVENHAGDLFSLFRFLVPDLLGSYADFSRRFAPGAGASAGSTSAEERRVATRRALRRLVQPFVLRRTKAQVLDDLPPLTEIQHKITLSAAEAGLYESVRRTALAKLSGAYQDPQARLQVLAEITKLRRLCCHPGLVVPDAEVDSSKLAGFLELVEELREGHHRALVFSQFVDMLTLAKSLLEQKEITFQYLDGSTPPKQRTAAVDAFQAGEGDVFLISLRAGGFGLNLTAADYVIHLDPWWNPAVEAQASDRAHRIGQTRPVTVYRLITARTIEEKIVELHRTKRDLADSLLEGTDRSAALSLDELRSLIAD
jgi:SNF2 family DNA or RNA helicase